MLILPTRSLDTAGRSYLQRSFANITGTTIVYPLTRFGFTTFMGPWVHSTVAKKRRQRQFPERSRWLEMVRKSKYGETVNRLARLCMWTTVWKVWCGLWHPTITTH